MTPTTKEPSASLAHSWRERFCEMDRDWSGVLRRQEEALLSDWRRAISDMQSQHDRLVADGRWVTGPSDFMAIINHARHENTHSRVLKWLLTPTARHGLGCSLAERFVEHCARKLPRKPLVVKEVTFSEWRHGREADLVVRGEGLTLIIENKVDAVEQPRQADDLYANFKNEIAPLFLFLTPDGREPLTATDPDARRAFRCISWPSVRTMIETALAESPSASSSATGVSVVENYLRTLKEQFG